MQEIDGEGMDEAAMGEPLQWCMHGGPGTGKSHVLRILRHELFEGLIKWTIGVNFQTTALQAVVAQLLGGGTIHHARGIPAIKRGADRGEREAAVRDCQARAPVEVAVYRRDQHGERQTPGR
eukprot:8686064-Pyramimonas_sp.AAC.1